MELAEGLTITGSIRLVRKLGEGGMGSVWVADHLGLHTQVAVKFMTADMAHSRDGAARFKREAMAAAQIKSPHVVQIYDHGLFEGRIPYIVMELLEGESLADFIRRHGTLPAHVVSQIVTQMCKALAKAHAGAVIHRDIKPDNVFLLDLDGEIFVKLLDFGIAKRLQDDHNITSTGALIGTLHYMSPEQLLGAKNVDARSDLWALGVVAYECMTGKVPFAGEAFGAIALAVMQQELTLPYAQDGVGSAAIDAWFARVLSKDREQRFASARETAETFAAAVAGSEAQPTAQPASPRVAALSARVESDSGRAPAAFATAARTYVGVRRRQVYAVALALGLGMATATGVFFLRGARGGAPDSVSPGGAPATSSAHSASARAAPVEVPPIAAAPELPKTSDAGDAAAQELPKTELTPARKSAARKPKSRRTLAGQATEEPMTTPSGPDRGF